MISRIKKIRFNDLARKLWLAFLLLFITIALFGPFITNEKPLICSIKGKTNSPVLQSLSLNKMNSIHNINAKDWRGIEYDMVVWAPVRYSENTIDAAAGAFTKPSFKPTENKGAHILGTDAFGRDVFAGMVAGTKTALLVGLISMVLAGFIGIILGLIAGFYGDTVIKMNWFKLLLTVLNIFFVLYLLFVLLTYQNIDEGTGFSSYLIATILPLLVGILFQFIIHFVGRFIKAKRTFSFPLDFIIMRVIEFLKAIPNLFLLLACLPLFRHSSIYNVIILIGFFYWPQIAVYVRAEVFKVKNEDYIKIAKLNGVHDWRLMWRHILPNSFQPAMVTIAFGFAAAVLAEASLSFLGIGIPINEVTWGSMLTMARDQFSAWWLAVFPGMAIFFTVISFNLLGDSLTRGLKN